MKLFLKSLALVLALGAAASMHADVEQSVSGYVYCQTNTDGIKRSTEVGIAGVKVFLIFAGYDDDLNTQSNVDDTQSTNFVFTAADGSYSFTNLEYGLYRIIETQPVGYLDGQDTLGSAGGTNISNDTFDVYLLAVHGTNYNFGEIKPPTITCPAPETVSCASQVPSPNIASVTANEGCCGPVTVTFVGDEISNQTCANRYTITRTYKAADACGREAVCTQTITVNDTEAPVITATGSTLTLGCNPNAAAIEAALGSATALDNCDLVTPVATTGDVVVDGCNRSQTRTWNAMDACGNPAAAVSRTVTWKEDNEAPVITATGSTLTLGCNPNAATIEAALGSATALDNCDAVTPIATTGDVVADGCNRSQTRTWNVMDGCGNSAAAVSRTVTWKEDNEAPVITATGSTLTLGCNPNAAAIEAALGSATALDNCDAVTPIATTGDVVANGCNRSQTRTWNVMDGCGNSAAAVSRTVTWKEDNEAPVITATGSTLTLGCNPNAAAIEAALGSATALDNCDAVTPIATNGDVVASGCNRSQTRTWNVMDGCGNSAVAVSRTVTWKEDNEAPVISATGSTLTLGCNPNAAAIEAALGSATALDNCDAVTPIATTGDVVANGCNRSRTRTWNVMDGCGNSAAAVSRTVTWKEDNEAPVITATGSTLTLGCNPNAAAIEAALGSATALDNCDSVTPVATTGGVVVNGCNRSQTRTWNAVDACGNPAAAVSRTVTWREDTIPPVITCPLDKQLACGASTDPSATGSATATDNCVVSPTITYSDSTSTNGSGDTVITRTWTASDGCNSSTCVQKITIGRSVCVPSIFSFNGNTPLNGPSGNMLLFTTNGISVKVTAFSRVKGSGGAWATAYLGVYSGGLGVTDTSEDGNNNTHTVDNIGRDNYVLFEFSTNIVLKRANLGYVVTDSDLTLWIGNAADPFNNHLTLSDLLLSGFYTENNLTNISTPRWANLNSGEIAGNAIVIAGWTTDTNPNDQFKIALLDICRSVCTTPLALTCVGTSGQAGVPYSSTLTPSGGIPPYTFSLLSGSLPAGVSLNPATGVINGTPANSGTFTFTAKVTDSVGATANSVCTAGCTSGCTITITPAPCAGSICGSVLRDCDANGSISGEQGLGGWTATLKNAAGTTVIATTPTAANGSYCFNNLAAGTYLVVVSTNGSDYTQTYDPDGVKDGKTSVTITNCQAKANVNFGFTGNKPNVNLVVTGPATAVCGQTITYTFYVTNTGNTCVYGGLIVNSALLGGQIFHQTPVNPGQGFTFQKTYVVKATDPNPLVMTSTAVGDPPGSLANVTKTVSVSTTKTCPPAGPPAPTYLTDVPGCNLVKLSWRASAGATSYNVKRSTVKGGPYTTIKTGLTVTNYTDAVSVVNGTVYYYVVTAVKNGVESANSNEASTIPTNGLPSPWNTADIGAVGDTGGASYTNPKFTVVGSGADIWGTADEFRYVYQMASGDCTIVARVVSIQNTDPWAKAGIMIRESLNANSKHASMFVTPGNGLAAHVRTNTGAITFNMNAPGLTAPFWLKGVRSGSVFTGYYSPNGVNWTNAGSVTLNMNSGVFIGLGVSSHNDGTLCPAVFENVTATP